MLSVSDRGPGIPAAQRELALTRFWRANPGDGQGAGLGLPIADRIARAHGGSLAIADRQGGGACVSLSVPLAASESPATSAEPARRADAGGAAPARGAAAAG